LAASEVDVAALKEISRSRSELASRVERASTRQGLPCHRTTGCPASISTSRKWFEGDRSLAICRTLAFARAVFEVAIEEKPAAAL
jgi:hypothetical protein